jgi:hypothetical protein
MEPKYWKPEEMRISHVPSLAVAIVEHLGTVVDDDDE